MYYVLADWAQGAAEQADLAIGRSFKVNQYLK